MAVLALASGALPTTGPTSAKAQQPATTAPLVFDGVTVVDMEHGTRIPDQRVVVASTRIQAVGPLKGTAVPPGAQVVDARGKYLIPGLWDMHIHSDAYSSFFVRFLAHGVTGIRNAAATASLDSLVQWRREILAGIRVGPPRQILVGQAISEQSRCQGKRRSDLGPHHICFTAGDSADARRVVDSLVGAGADMIKTYKVERAMYFVIAAAARRLGVPLGGHTVDPRVTGAVTTALEAADSGASILDHLTWAGDIKDRCWVQWWQPNPQASVERCQPVAEAFRRHNTWWVPTLLSERLQVKRQTVATLLVDGRVTTGPDSAQAVDLIRNRYGSIFERYRKRTNELFSRGKQYQYSPDQTPVPPPPSLDSLDYGHILGIARAVDLPILAGTDVTPVPGQSGLSLHTELALLVAAGLPPLAALQAATLNPAKMLRATDSLGTVAPGKLADLVLLDADPLENIANTTAIRAVVANGRYFDRDALDKLLSQP